MPIWIANKILYAVLCVVILSLRDPNPLAPLHRSTLHIKQHFLKLLVFFMTFSIVLWIVAIVPFNESFSIWAWWIPNLGSGRRHVSTAHGFESSAYLLFFLPTGAPGLHHRGECCFRDCRISALGGPHLFKISGTPMWSFISTSNIIVISSGK